MTFSKKTRQWVVAIVVLVGALEVGSRILFGNYAQSALVERVDDTALCMVLGKNRTLTYTGWYRKVDATEMQSDDVSSRGFVKSNKKQVDITKVFMLGDSFTYGQGVNIEYSLPHLVNLDLGDHYTVWNFGVPGRNFYQMASDIQRLMVYKPDVILVNLFINDFHEPPGECMLSATTDWQMPLMRWCHVCRWSLLGVGAVVSEQAYLTSPQIEQQVVDHIAKIERIGRDHDVPIVFALLMDHQVHRAFEPTLPAIHTLVQQHSTRWIDLDKTWSTLLWRESEYQILGEYHWNNQGNQVLAQAYAQALQNQQNTIFTTPVLP